jgi:hypothetical protein
MMGEEFIEKYFEHFREKTLTAKFIYHVLAIYFGIDFQVEEVYDVMPIIRKLNIDIEQCDRYEGYKYYNEITKAQRRRLNRWMKFINDLQQI